MYIYIYIHIHIKVCVCMYIYIYKYVCIYIYTHTKTYSEPSGRCCQKLGLRPEHGTPRLQGFDQGSSDRDGVIRGS